MATDPPTSSGLRERVRERAAEHEILLQREAETREAGATYLKLKEEYQTRRDKLWNSNRNQLAKETHKKYKEFQSLKNSNFRSLLKPGFKAALEKAEDEHLELSARYALFDKEEEAIEGIRSRRDAAQLLSQSNGEALVALEKFYSSIFDGPTYEYSQEDELEKDAGEIQKEYDEFQNRMTQAAAVVNKISEGRMGVRRAVTYAQAAYKTFIDGLQEQDVVNKYILGHSSARSVARELGWVKRGLAEAEALMAEAREKDSKVAPFYQPKMVDIQKILDSIDVLGVGYIECDNGFSDEILATKADIQLCEKKMDDEVDAADERRANLEKERPKLAAAREAAQEKLLKLRRELYEKVLKEEETKK